MSLRAYTLSWFPVPSPFPLGHPQAQKKAWGAACTVPPPTLEALLPRPPPHQQPVALGSLLWVPPTYSQVLKFVIVQAEPVRRGPAPPARPLTAQEVCYRRAQQAQRASASWLQAAQRPAEKLSSAHISAPGERKRIAHIPNPRLAAGESRGMGPGPLTLPVMA